MCYYVYILYNIHDFMRHCSNNETRQKYVLYINNNENVLWFNLFVMLD